MTDPNGPRCVDCAKRIATGPARMKQILAGEVDPVCEKCEPTPGMMTFNRRDEIGVHKQ